MRRARYAPHAGGRDGAAASRSTRCRSTAATISISRCSCRASRAPYTRTTERFAETSAVPGTGISVAGQRNLGNTFIVDGLSANDDAADLAGTYFAEEVIREFQVITSGGIAEFGRASAGTSTSSRSRATNAAARPRLWLLPRRRARRAQCAGARAKDPLRAGAVRASAVGGPRARATARSGSATSSARDQDKHRLRHDRAGERRRVNRALDARRLSAARGSAPASSRPATTRPTCSAASTIAVSDATGSSRALQPLRRRQRQRAQRRRPERREPRHAARQHRPDRRRSTCSTSLGRRLVNELRAQSRAAASARRPTTRSARRSTISGVASFGTSTLSPTRRDLDVFELPTR